jgi:hypothetical protein
VTISHPDITVITKKVETATEQVERQGNASPVLDLSGIVLVEFLSEGLTVNQYYYEEILRHLSSSVHLSVLSFGEKRTGCCHITLPLHITCFCPR